MLRVFYVFLFWLLITTVSGHVKANEVIDNRYLLTADNTLVRDVFTGLEWQRCSLGQEWTGTHCEGEPTLFTPDSLAGLVLPEGFTLPNNIQLRSLVFCSASWQYDSNGNDDACDAFPEVEASTINLVAFPNTPDGLFLAADAETDAFYAVNFSSGTVSLIDSALSQTSFAVRLVRAGEIMLIDNRYLPLADGSLVLDVVTGLEWQRCSVGQTWNGTTCEGDAELITWAVAKELTLAGGFVAPKNSQLQTLIYCGEPDGYDRPIAEFGWVCPVNNGGVFINQLAFPNPMLFYWADNTNSLRSENAIQFNFGRLVNWVTQDGFGLTCFWASENRCLQPVRLVRAKPTHTILFDRIGNGNGTVSSSQFSNNCGAACKEAFPIGTQVTLTANLGADSRFVGWTGCGGAQDQVVANQCTVTVTHNRVVKANFERLGSVLTVQKQGGGTVYGSDISLINCGPKCQTEFPYPFNDSVIITAATPNGISFTGWEGCDSVDGVYCTVSMQNSRTVVANFAQVGSTFTSIADAVDNNSVAWSTGGNRGWFGQTVHSVQGGDAAQSGAIGDSQQTLLQTAVVGPGELKFSWKVSSEAGFDRLEFFINSIEQQRISGEVDWQERVFQLGAGEHTLIWRYIKDGSDAAGADAGWVDSVQWLPEATSYAVNVDVSGNGIGTVESNLPGIACGMVCSADFMVNANIILTATPAAGSTFVGWSGCANISSNQCYLAMQSDINIAAEFRLQVYNLVLDIGVGGSLVSGASNVEHGTRGIFELLPEQGFQVNRVVGGSCPLGRWLSATRYETGVALEACSVSFSFKPVRPKKRKLPIWLLIES